LKDVDKILELLDDKRRTRESTKRNILETFDKIKAIVEKAQEYNFSVANAEVNTYVGTATIVGPTVDEFAAVVAQAIEDDTVTQIEGETVMNAASVQLVNSTTQKRCCYAEMLRRLICTTLTITTLFNCHTTGNLPMQKEYLTSYLMRAIRCS
jgi:predicted RNA methylase